MTERKKDALALAALLAVLILFFAKILFTSQIIRAPDITSEFYWTVKSFKDFRFLDLFRVNLHAGWDMLANGGTSEGGGTLSMQFLFYRNLIFWLFPAPANVAWFILFHLFVAAAGTYFCCRSIGAGRKASFLGGIVFALAPEIASLINAGHVQKIATISFAPWAFYLFERGFKTRRLIFFLATGVVLAFQFFNMHWQIAYYTCLGLGGYGVLRLAFIAREERKERGGPLARLVALNLATLFFFLSTVAISLIPVADWAKETTRGAHSGANEGKGGLNVDEAMSWSLPPEELVTFVAPGFFGLSRQEGGYNGTSVDAYYWGRMNFTQTTDYMGLLPWLLLPLPLFFRRDCFTWAALAAIAAGVLFSMGRYTPVYWFLYEHFPGVNHFRVPKMMMFLPVLGLAVLAARGLDLLLDQETRQSNRFRLYLKGLLVVPLVPALLLGSELAAKSSWLQLLGDMISQPTRFEQGSQLIDARWQTLVRETGTAVLVTALHVAVIACLCRWRKAAGKPFLFLFLLLGLYVADTGRIDRKFMLLQPLPEQVRGVKTPAIEFLSRQSNQYRTLVLDGGDPMQYVTHGIPVLFTSNPIQMQRWQNFLDVFVFTSAMPDMMNVRYLVYKTRQYEESKGELGAKYVPVYYSPDGEVVVENRSVLPKAWLVPAVAVEPEPLRVLEKVASLGFDPRSLAVVEAPSPLPLTGNANLPGEVRVARYEGNRITVNAVTGGAALLVLGEKYAKGWQATVDGTKTAIIPVNYILRGVYLPPGRHTVDFVFDPLPFKIGKILTLTSLGIFVLLLGREFFLRRRSLKTQSGTA